MRKLIITLIALGTIFSALQIQTPPPVSAGVSLKIVQLPVRPHHLRVWGDEVIMCGIRTAQTEYGPYDFPALAVGNARGGFSLKYAPFPTNYEKIPSWPPHKDPYKWCLSVGKLGNLYAFSTVHQFIMWMVGDAKYDTSNISGWGADDITVFDGKLIGDVEGVISIHQYHQEYTLITGPFRKYEEKYRDVLLPILLVPIGEKLYILGDKGYMVTDKNFKPIKMAYEEEINDWKFPQQFGQAGYDVYKNRYIIYASDFSSDVVVFDTKTEKFGHIGLRDRIDDLPASPQFVTVTPSGIVYAAVINAKYRGKIVAMKFDEANLGFTKLWEMPFDHTIYALDNYGETIYIAMGEDGLGILSTGGLSFSDVPQGYWAYDAIMALAQRGVINGYPDGTFRPEKGVTRAEFAKMLAVYMNLPLQCDPSLPEVKEDVKEKDWFCPYVSAVVKAGYMKGYGSGRFGPNDPVKKEEILTTLVRIKGYKLVKPGTPTFPDVPKTHWAYPYIETAVAHGLVKKIDPHITDGNFHLGKPATRAQTAVFLYRMGR